MTNRRSQDGKRDRIIARLTHAFQSRPPKYGELASIARELGVSRQIVHAYFADLQVHGRVYRPPPTPTRISLPEKSEKQIRRIQAELLRYYRVHGDLPKGVLKEIQRRMRIKNYKRVHLAKERLSTAGKLRRRRNGK